MKLFTKQIDSQLFAQYPMGADLENQKVVAKIFNPYGRGTWFIINSDPNDPDYLWAIVDLFEVEVGSVSRMDLETIKVPPFRLGLERDMSFEPKNALEVYRGLLEGKSYEHGGSLSDENKQMVLNQAEGFEHHAEELEAAAKKADHIPAWVVAKSQRASTDLSDITHYLDGENEQKRELSEGEEYKKGGLVGDVHSLTDELLSQKIQIFLDNIKPIKYYYIDQESNMLIVGLDENYKQDAMEKLYKEATSSMEFFDANSVDMQILPNKEVQYRIKLKKSVKFADGGMTDVSDLEGKYINIFLAGVKEPINAIIENVSITDEKFRNRDVIIKTRSGAEEIFPLEKLNDFLSGNLIDMKDSKEPYAIQLTKYKMKDGGYMAKGGGFNQYGEPYGFDYSNESPYEFHHKEGYKKPYKVWDKIDGQYIAEFDNRQSAIEFIERKEMGFAKGGYMAKGGETKQLHAKLIHKEIGIEYYKDGSLINPTKSQKLSWEIYGLPKDVEKIEESFETIIDEYSANTKKEIQEKLEKNIQTEKYEYLGVNPNLHLVFDNKMADGGYMAKGGEIYKIQVFDKYDIIPKWEDDTWHTGGKKYLNFKDAQKAVKKLQGDTAYAHQKFKVVEDKDKMAMGGVTFDDKVRAVKSSLLKRKNVSTKVQKDYGKTYSPKEAEESAKRIVGAMTAKERLMKSMKKGKK